MRRALILVAALVLAAPAAAAASYGDTLLGTPGLVAYWPLDEPSGSSSITDVAGQRTAPLNATYGLVPGIDTGGTSVDLNGLGAANFGTSISPTGDRTIEAWVSERNTTADRYVVSQGTTTSGYHLYLAAGGIPTFQVNGTRITGPTLARGTWHHLAATLAGRTMTLWVDDTIASTDLPADPAATSQSFWIGRLSRASSGAWVGGLDEIALYDHALDGATVMAHFEAGLNHIAPVTTLTSTPPALTSSPIARFTFVGSKPGLTFSCRVDGGAWNLCLSNDGFADFGRLKEGAHTFEVRATDHFGTVEAAPPAFHWTIDLTPPRSFLLIAQPTALRPGTAVVGSEPGATFQCRSQTGAWAACPAAFPLPDLGHSYGLFVRAVDAAGNIESGESSATVKARPAGIPFTGAPAEFTPALVPISGRSSWSCSVDGAPATTCPSPLVYSGLGYGTHTLQVSDPDAPGYVWPTLTWTEPLPAPVLAGAQFPALVVRGARRVPRLLVQSNAPAQAQLVLQRRGRTISRWSANVKLGSNVLALRRSTWRLLRAGRYVLSVQVANATGSAARVAVRFDVVHALRR